MTVGQKAKDIFTNPVVISSGLVGLAFGVGNAFDAPFFDFESPTDEFVGLLLISAATYLGTKHDQDTRVSKIKQARARYDIPENVRREEFALNTSKAVLGATTGYLMGVVGSGIYQIADFYWF